VVSDLYLFMILIFYPGEYMTNYYNKLSLHDKMAVFRSPMEQNEHCPVCDKHVPDVRFKGTVNELKQVNDDAWILADGSVACEDGHGGLMVEICIDCLRRSKFLFQ